MNKQIWKRSALTFLVGYLIYRLFRMGLDIFFHHYAQWTGHDLAHLTQPITLTVLLAGVAGYGFYTILRTPRRAVQER
jgi:hypothetical protein